MIVKRFSVVLLSCILAAPALAVSPWLPTVGGHELGVSYINQSADRFYVGKDEMNLPTDLKLRSFQLSYAYGLSERWALDVLVGYADSDFLVDPGLAPRGGLNGITDTRIGLRWLAFEQDEDRPFTLTLAGAVLIKGDYDTGAITAIGDGANGIELSVITGRSFDSGFVWQSELGYRLRDDEVANEWFFNRTLSYVFSDALSGRLGWNSVDSRGNLDIGGPGFSPARFPALEEDYHLGLVGVSIAPNEHWSLGFDYGRKFDGRNTARSDVFAFGLSRGF